MTDGQILSEIRGVTWSNFAMSIARQIMDGKALSDRQRSAILNFIDKVRKPAPEIAAPKVLTGIVGTLTTAKIKNVKKPIMRVNGYTFKFAPDFGKNPGSIYVTREGDVYVGRITPDGVLQLTAGNIDDRRAIEMIDSDPRAALQKFGIDTGICGICGRTLTDPASISAGIGPICAAKWGV